MSENIKIIPLSDIDSVGHGVYVLTLGSIMQWIRRCYGEIETHRSANVEIEVTRLLNSIITVSRKELHEGAIKYVRGCSDIHTSTARQE
jgi:hypothetical protein